MVDKQLHFSISEEVHVITAAGVKAKLSTFIKPVKEINEYAEFNASNSQYTFPRIRLSSDELAAESMGRTL